MSEENSVPSEEVVSEEVSQEGDQSLEASQEESSQDSQPTEREQLQDAVETALANGASEKQVQNLIKKFQLKVNGKVIDKEIDLSDEKTLKNELQLAAAARQSIAEANNLKKMFESEFGRLKNDPFSVLAELGLDPDQLAEARLRQRVEELKKSPEQIEQEKIRKELEEARQEAKRLKEEKEAIEFAKLQEQAAVEIEDEILTALDAHKTLPKTRHITKRIADSLLWAIDNGFPNATAEDVIPMVEKEWREEIGDLMDGSPEELLEAIIGKRNIERLMAKKAPKLPAKVPSLNQIKPTTASVASSKEQPKKKISSREFFNNLGKKK